MPLRKKNNNQQPQRDNRSRGSRPPQTNGNDDERFQRRASGTQNKNVKKKRPVSALKAFFIALLAAFIMSVMMGGALIMFDRMNTNKDFSVYRTQLETAVNEVREASSNIILTPVEENRDAAIQPNVNIAVAKDNNGVEYISYGSGVVLTQDGYILTNYHVIQGFKTIACTIDKTEYYNVTVAGYDDTSDLAVLKVDARDLSVARIGDSGNIKQGDWVMAVGNPYGLKDSISTGCISAMGRNFSMPSGSITVTYANMIQTDALVYEGSSGGGLYNSNGELIGINTLVNVDLAHSQSIGYAIPIEFAIRMADRLKDGKLAQHASFGVQYGDVTDQMVQTFGLTSRKGAVAQNVTMSGAAQTAGIVVDDIIIEYNGETVENAMDMYYKVRAMPPETVVPVTVLRGGKTMEFQVRLGSDVQ